MSKNKVVNNLSFLVIEYIVSESSELIMGHMGADVGWSYTKDVMESIPVQLRDCACSLL